MEMPAVSAHWLSERMSSINFKEAYFHILIAKSGPHKYLRLIIAGYVYQFLAFSSKLALVFLVFTHVLGVVVNYPHHGKVQRQS